MQKSNRHWLPSSHYKYVCKGVILSWLHSSMLAHWPKEPLPLLRSTMEKWWSRRRQPRRSSPAAFDMTPNVQRRFRPASSRRSRACSPAPGLIFSKIQCHPPESWLTFNLQICSIHQLSISMKLSSSEMHKSTAESMADGAYYNGLMVDTAGSMLGWARRCYGLKQWWLMTYTIIH